MRRHLLLPLLALIAAGPAQAETPPPERADGVVRVFGPEGPHTAFRRAAAAFSAETGTPVQIVSGPRSRWHDQARAGADILFSAGEHTMTAFLDAYDAFDSADAEPLYIRPAVIAVPKGNPGNIQAFVDLLGSETRVVVTKGTGLWEDIAGRQGHLDDVARLRRNIVLFADTPRDGLAALTDPDTPADAWITWLPWPLTHSDRIDHVDLAAERRLYRVTNVVVAPEADPEARAFVDFLKSDTAARIFASEGWRR